MFLRVVTDILGTDNNILNEKLLTEASWIIQLLTSSEDEIKLLNLVKKYEIYQILQNLSQHSNFEIMGHAIWSFGNLIQSNPCLKELMFQSKLFTQISLRIESVWKQQQHENLDMLLTSYFHFLFSFLSTSENPIPEEVRFEFTIWISRELSAIKSFPQEHIPPMLDCLRCLLKRTGSSQLKKFHKLDFVSDLVDTVMRLASIPSFDYSEQLIEIMIELTHKTSESLRKIVTQSDFQIRLLDILADRKLGVKPIALLNNLFVDPYFIDSLEKNGNEKIVFDLLGIIAENFKRNDDQISTFLSLQTLNNLLFQCDHEYIITYILQNLGKKYFLFFDFCIVYRKLSLFDCLI